LVKVGDRAIPLERGKVPIRSQVVVVAITVGMCDRERQIVGLRPDAP
jgi:hypothetical protein